MTNIGSIFGHTRSVVATRDREVERQTRSMVRWGKVNGDKVRRCVDRILDPQTAKPNSKSRKGNGGTGTKPQSGKSGSVDYLALEKLYFRYPKEVGKIVFDQLRASKGQPVPAELRAMARHHEELVGYFTVQGVLERTGPDPDGKTIELAIGKLDNALRTSGEDAAVRAARTLLELMHVGKAYEDVVDKYLTHLAATDKVALNKAALNLVIAEAREILSAWSKDKSGVPLPHRRTVQLALTGPGKNDYRSIAKEISKLPRAKQEESPNKKLSESRPRRQSSLGGKLPGTKQVESPKKELSESQPRSRPRRQSSLGSMNSSLRQSVQTPTSSAPSVDVTPAPSPRSRQESVTPRSTLIPEVSTETRRTGISGLLREPLRLLMAPKRNVLLAEDGKGIRREAIIAVVDKMCTDTSKFFTKDLKKSHDTADFRALDDAFRRFPGEVAEAVSAGVREYRYYKSTPRPLLRLAAMHEKASKHIYPNSALFSIYQVSELKFQKKIKPLQEQIKKLQDELKTTEKQISTTRQRLWHRKSDRYQKKIDSLTNKKNDLESNIAGLEARVDNLRLESQKAHDKQSQRIADLLVQRLESHDPALAQNAADTIMILLQRDNAELRETLRQFILARISQYHSTKGNNQLSDQRRARVETAFGLLARGAMKVIGAWQDKTGYKEDPDHLNALLVLMADEQGLDGTSAIRASARLILTRYRESTEEFAPVTITEHRVDTRQQGKKPSNQARTMWSSYFPQEPAPVDYLGLLRSNDSRNSNLALASLCSNYKNGALEKRAFQQIWPGSGQPVSLEEVNSTLGYLARRYAARLATGKGKEEPPLEDVAEFARQYDEMTDNNFNYSSIKHQREFLELNRLMTLSEIGRMPQGNTEDIFFQPVDVQYTGTPEEVNRQLNEFRRSKAKYFVMPVLRGHHFVTLVVTKSEDEPQSRSSIFEEYGSGYRSPVRLHAAVLDSLPRFSPGLKEYLGKLHFDTCSLHAGKLQEGSGKNEFEGIQRMTNSCGIFSTLLYDHLLRTLDGDPSTQLTADEVVNNFTSDFVALNDEDRSQINLFRRLQLFDNYVRHGEV